MKIWMDKSKQITYAPGPATTRQTDTVVSNYHYIYIYVSWDDPLTKPKVHIMNEKPPHTNTISFYKGVRL